jgi:hypothetical protein
MHGASKIIDTLETYHSTISIIISTPPYFVIIDFITIGDIVRLLLFIYYKIFNTMVMIVDPIMCE